MSNLVSYTQIKESNKLKALFEKHATEKAAIKKFSTFADDHADIIPYFTSESGTYITNLAKTVFDYDRAKKVLDAHYWNEVIKYAEIFETMPANKRMELHTQISECKTPEFEPEIVLNTIESLLLQRHSFLADKVDGVFSNLSKTHVTNNNMAFRTRMILNYAVTTYGHGSQKSYTTGYSTCQHLNDLRQIIAQITGKDFKQYPETSRDLRFILDQDAFGEWFHFDGGAISMRIYKAGTVHLDVHPEVAFKLNDILATKYPSVICEPKKAGKKVKVFKHMELRKDTLSFEVISVLLSCSEDLQRNSKVYSYSKEKNQCWDEVVKILELLGGIEDKGDYVFTFDVVPAIKKIIMLGCLPDKQSHQFYPTKSDLASRMVMEAEIEPDHKCLEPSAGHGGIAEHFPHKEDLTCIEVDPMHCEILKSKGFKAVQMDFLSVNEDDKKNHYDRIVMNPPFHNSQVIQHVSHAAKLLKKGGVLVALMPSTYKDNDYMFKGAGVDVTWSEVLIDQFDHTSIRVVIAKAVRVR